MIKLIKETSKKLGVDKSIAYSSGARVIQAFAGVASIFFIGKYLTGIEQGFYYTFGSIIAIQVFFELGLTNIITQFVAHEASHLQIDQYHTLHGNNKYQSRLSSLLHFCIKWYAIIGAILLVVLLATGFIFFGTYGEESERISWQLPWALVSVGTVIKLFQAPLNSYLMGLGKVKEMSKISFYQQLILPLSTWIGLMCSFKLYVTGISSLLATLIWQIYVYRTSLYKILKNIWNTKIEEKIDYLQEIFPYQWKIALSWISGYFIFQLFNPVLFATEGAKVAGQMGMTITALNGIQALSMSWSSTKIPLYSSLIAQKKYNELDIIFNRTLKQMSIVCLILLLIFFIGILGLNKLDITLGNEPLHERFLSYLPMILMMIPLFINQIVNSWATYLRCHKKEPFLYISIVSGLLCCCSTTLMGKYLGIYGVTGGYCAITLALMPWSYWIFKTKKRSWHS